MHDDDGRDPTILTNPWFWLIVLVCVCGWIVALWAVLS